jgi:hypothetical protein
VHLLCLVSVRNVLSQHNIELIANNNKVGEKVVSTTIIIITRSARRKSQRQLSSISAVSEISERRLDRVQKPKGIAATSYQESQRNQD